MTRTDYPTLLGYCAALVCDLDLLTDQRVWSWTSSPYRARYSGWSGGKPRLLAYGQNTAQECRSRCDVHTIRGIQACLNCLDILNICPDGKCRAVSPATVWDTIHFTYSTRVAPVSNAGRIAFQDE